MNLPSQELAMEEDCNIVTTIVILIICFHIVCQTSQ